MTGSGQRLKMKFERLVSRAWYGNRSWIKVLAPLSRLYQREAERRKRLALENSRLPFVVPVVVVGNITTGGTGKTPLIIYLANQLKARGIRVGVVSRGYGAQPPSFPYLVQPGDQPGVCGDEPLMIAEATRVPVVIDPNRCAAVDILLNQGVSLVLSDDGLQHYALPRNFEIAVLDGNRGLGNGLLIPAGPLREPPERLASVDFVVCNGSKDNLDPALPVDIDFQLQPAAWVNLVTGTRVPLDFLSASEQVDAVAGIGHPSRFFDSLRELGFTVREHAFPDHHLYRKEDFGFLSSFQNATVLMTTKDALKCRSFAGPNFWALDVDVEFETNALGENAGRSLVDAIAALRDYE